MEWQLHESHSQDLPDHTAEEAQAVVKGIRPDAYDFQEIHSSELGKVTGWTFAIPCDGDSAPHYGACTLEGIPSIHDGFYKVWNTRENAAAWACSMHAHHIEQGAYYTPETLGITVLADGTLDPSNVDGRTITFPSDLKPSTHILIGYGRVKDTWFEFDVTESGSYYLSPYASEMEAQGKVAMMLFDTYASDYYEDGDGDNRNLLEGYYYDGDFRVICTPCKWGEDEEPVEYLVVTGWKCGYPGRWSTHQDVYAALLTVSQALAQAAQEEKDPATARDLKAKADHVCLTTVLDQSSRLVPHYNTSDTGEPGALMGFTFVAGGPVGGGQYGWLASTDAQTSDEKYLRESEALQALENYHRGRPAQALYVVTHSGDPVPRAVYSTWEDAQGWVQRKRRGEHRWETGPRYTRHLFRADGSDWTPSGFLVTPRPLDPEPPAR